MPSRVYREKQLLESDSDTPAPTRRIFHWHLQLFDKYFLAHKTTGEPHYIFQRPI